MAARRTNPETERLERSPDGRNSFVFASFRSVDDAVDAARDLERRGYEREQISVFMSQETRGRFVEQHPELVEDEDGTVVVRGVELKKGKKTLEGLGAGSAIGGALGAAAAAVAAVGTTLLIPPLGIAVAGPLAAALAGAGAGAAAGGLVGALVGAGLSEYRAREFERMVKAGNVIVGAASRTEAERRDLEDQLRSSGGDLVRDQDDLVA